MMNCIAMLFFVLSMLSGCTWQAQPRAVTPLRASPPAATIVFISGHKELDLIPDQIVEIGRIDIIGEGFGGGAHATAELSGDKITVVTESDMGGTHKGSSLTIAISDLPVEVSGIWGAGTIQIRRER